MTTLIKSSTSGRSAVLIKFFFVVQMVLWHAKKDKITKVEEWIDYAPKTSLGVKSDITFFP